MSLGALHAAHVQKGSCKMRHQKKYLFFCTSMLTLAMTSQASAAVVSISNDHVSGSRSDIKKRSAKVGYVTPHTKKNALPVGKGEEVLVSTQRAAFGQGRMQHVGVSTTHISAETLTRHQVTDVKGLMNLAPNLTIQPQGGSSNVNFSLRGVGLKDFTSNNTPSVMTYVDDVALPIGFMAGSAIYDLAGVDVVTGPVGFSHGQTVTAGEINIHTADPTKTFHYGGSEDLATYARSITNVYASGPITHNLQYRIAGYTQQGGGFQTNRYTGQSLGNANKGGLRGKLAWQPDEKTNIVVSANWMQDNSEAIGAYNVLDNVKHTPTYTNNLQTAWGFRPDFLKLIGKSGTKKPSYNNTFWGATVNMTRDLGFAQLASISSYQQMYVHNLMDLDATPYAIYDDQINTNANMFSQELRLSSQNQSSRFQWAAGMYYDRTQMKSSFFNDYTDSGSRPYVQRTSYKQDQQAFSQYGRIRFAATSKLHLIAGISHESDDRSLHDMRTKRYNTAIYTTHFDNLYPQRGALTNQFAGMGGIEYQVLDNFMLYGNIRKGFKPGGFTANNTVIASQLNPTKPESLLAYEVGFKSDFFHHKLRVNTDAFWYNYHGQQILGLNVVPNYGVVGQYVNIPKSQIWGVEMEIDASPIKNFLLHQHIGYERGVYKNFNSIDSAAVTAHYQKTGVYEAFYQSYSGTDSGIPKLTLEGSASYKIILSRNWNLTPYIDYSYRGSQLDVPGNNIYRLPAYFLMDMGMTFAPTSKKWSLSVYSTNILDRHYDMTRDIGLNGFYGIPGTPRMVGGRFSIDL
ncbi:TonB-dependent receptor [Acetobacter indonesiensis]